MVATKSIDFHKGHDSLAAMVKYELREDPFIGTIFVFRAKKADWPNLLYTADTYPGSGGTSPASSSCSCRRPPSENDEWRPGTEGLVWAPSNALQRRS